MLAVLRNEEWQNDFAKTLHQFRRGRSSVPFLVEFLKKFPGESLDPTKVKRDERNRRIQAFEQDYFAKQKEQ